MIGAWSVTGAGLATAIIAGALANGAKNDQVTLRDKLGATRSELDDAQSKTTKLANVSDGFLIGSGVVALASTYLTIRAVGWHGEASPVKVDVGVGRVTVGGSF